MARWSIDEVPGLDEAERAWLKDQLQGFSITRRQIFDEDGLHVIADDGYEIEIRSSWGEKARELRLGRSQIHEQLAIQRLRKLGQSRASGLHGLFYPGATPPQEVLFQAALYFD
jgi:hypothetical protein